MRGPVRSSLTAAALAAALLTLPAGTAAADPGDNVVLQWNSAALQGDRDSHLGPPMVARALAIIHTCVYDAWAAYDPVANGTRLGGTLRRPPAERTLANKAKAISYAALRAASDVFPGDVALYRALMTSLGYDPDDASTNTATPQGVGNVACRAVLDFRHHDGSNQLGDEPGGSAGVAYSDYTGYAPANAPMNLLAPFDDSTVLDPNRWQPLTYRDATGAVVTPGWVGPQWNRVIPFGLTSDSQLRSPTGPARFGTQQFVDQARELIDISAHLTDRQKSIAEYWADGPHSEAPPGHWNLFAQYVARRDGHGTSAAGIDADVKLFFALTNAIFDAGITAWDNKRAYDSVRPITAIRHLFRGQPIEAWAGPGLGTRTIDGGSWLPYQASTFPTPPFAEYSSGHSTFSAAGAEILRLFTGSDAFGASVTIAAGSSKVEPGAVPAAPVTLAWPTFSAAADEAGISRRYGGIHFEQADLDGRIGGRKDADAAWAKAQSYWRGDVSTACPDGDRPIPVKLSLNLLGVKIVVCL
jgi:hypothetical protein